MVSGIHKTGKRCALNQHRNEGPRGEGARNSGGDQRVLKGGRPKRHERRLEQVIGSKNGTETGVAVVPGNRDGHGKGQTPNTTGVVPARFRSKKRRTLDSRCPPTSSLTRAARQTGGVLQRPRGIFDPLRHT